MTERGLVSVVLPNRNHAHFLPRALDALRSQTWTNFEVIVVDDQSSDDSLVVLERYRELDSRIRYLSLAEHGGIATAVNSGIEVAKGEFLYLAAADDFVASQFIERCVTEMNRRPNAGMSFSDPTEFRDETNDLRHFPLYLSDRPIFVDGKSLADLVKQNYFHISTNTGLYRRSAFQEVGGYRADLHWFMDWFAASTIAFRYGVCYLPEQLTYLTVRGDSYSARNLRDGKMQGQLMKRMMALLATREFSDVTPLMQRAGLLPEYQPRTLMWLLESRVGRGFLTPYFLQRVASRYVWSFLRPIASIQLRRQMRQLHSRRTHTT